MIAMYEMLQEEVQMEREAAGGNAQALQALRVQRIANVEMEARLSLLEEAKTAAESEVAIAQVLAQPLLAGCFSKRKEC